MRNKYVQMSLYDTYKSVAASMEDDKPKLFRLLDEHIDWDTLIPARFYLAFYRNTGRPRKYPLAAFLKSLVLQKNCSRKATTERNRILPGWLIQVKTGTGSSSQSSSMGRRRL